MNPHELAIRIAQQGDAAAISALAYRSKSYWDYDQQFMAACRDELTYSAKQIESSQVEFFICESQGRIIAFYALAYDSTAGAELEAMFVEPDFIGRGVGRILFAHAVTQCEAKRTTKLIVQADEFAADFYKRMGAVSCGTRESGSIAGRHLPVLEYTFADGTTTKGVLE